MKDSEIKTDDIRSKINSAKNFVELRFEELIDSINDIKNDVISRLEEKMDKNLESLQNESKSYENRIEYFDAVLSQVKQLQNTNSADEDLLGFFFANQQRIEGIINGEGIKGNVGILMEKYEKIENTINDELANEMKVAYPN